MSSGCDFYSTSATQDASRVLVVDDAGAIPTLRDSSLSSSSDGSDDAGAAFVDAGEPDAQPSYVDAGELERDAGSANGGAVDAGELEPDAHLVDAGGELEPMPGQPCAPCLSSSECAARPPLAGAVCSDIGDGARCYPFNSDCAALGWAQRGALCVPEDGCR